MAIRGSWIVTKQIPFCSPIGYTPYRRAVLLHGDVVVVAVGDVAKTVQSHSFYNFLNFVLKFCRKLLTLASNFMCFFSVPCPPRLEVVPFLASKWSFFVPGGPGLEKLWKISWLEHVRYCCMQLR